MYEEQPRAIRVTRVEGRALTKLPSNRKKGICLMYGVVGYGGVPVFKIYGFTREATDPVLPFAFIQTP